ncbi:MAG: tetratricopeptide repeat protein [Paenibacillaceae bacterium]|nr:tetratricopeptide repeat protein [Paenibacillaceae bacterium]
MFKHLFAAMHESLEQIAARYPNASPNERKELDRQMSALKTMSDVCVEEWLQFEEKMAAVLALPTGSAENQAQAAAEPSAVASASAALSAKMPPPAEQQPSEPFPVKHLGPQPPADPEDLETFERGQGYYKLAMFDKAAEHFALLARMRPDNMVVRIHLAMCHLRLGDYAESYRLLQFVLPLTDNHKIKAIGYNAMGCIQARNHNLDKAMEYFRKAYRSDPDAMEAALTPAPGGRL